MGITEIQEKLEEIQNDLCITYETSHAIESVLTQRILDIDKLSFALMGVTERIGQSEKAVGEIVEEIIKIRSIVNQMN